MIKIDYEVNELYDAILDNLHDLQSTLMQYFTKSTENNYGVRNSFTGTAKPAGSAQLA